MNGACERSVATWFERFGGAKMSATTSAMGSWSAVVETIRKHYENPDTEAARILCAAIASHTLKDFRPAWCLAIAPSGSMKTDILESFRGLPRVHFIDEVTPQTFISGKMDDPKKKKRTTPASLLHRIGDDGIVIIADFSTFTSNPKTLRTILSQLRRIYDGHFSREFGTDEHMAERAWEGRLTVIAASVPDIDNHHSLFQKLGERFIRTRWPRAGGAETGLRAMRHTRVIERELKAAVQSLLYPILTGPQTSPSISEHFQTRIAGLSEFVALARTYVERDTYSRVAVGVPSAEGNTRLPQELCQIARGSAILDGRCEANENDYRLVFRAALDSLPPVRLAVLKSIVEGKSPHSTRLPKATVARAVEDLQLVGILASERSLTDSAKALLKGAAVAPNPRILNEESVPETTTHEQEKNKENSPLPDFREPTPRAVDSFSPDSLFAPLPTVGERRSHGV